MLPGLQGVMPPLDSSQQQPQPHMVGLATLIPVHTAGEEGAGCGEWCEHGESSGAGGEGGALRNMGCQTSFGLAN